MYGKEIFTTDKENNKREIRMIENELVPVYETSTGEKVVYGTELYEILGARSKFADWIKNRLNDCEATENDDFEAFSKNLENGGRTKEYIIRLDIAKEMAMLERNEKGKRVRRYFIDIEKKYKDHVTDDHKSVIHDNNRKPSIAEATETVRLIRSIYADAGVDPRYIAATAKCIFKEAGVDLPLPIEMKEDKLYDQTEIAKELGIMSAAGKPHSQAVGTIISMLDISDDDKITTPYTNHGHSGVVTQYTGKVFDKVKEWLRINDYPKTICGSNKSFKVNYT